MMPRNDGNYQAYSWATYTFIRLWLCAMVREKKTEKWGGVLVSPVVGNIEELNMEKRTQPRHNFILTYF